MKQSPSLSHNRLRGLTVGVSLLLAWVSLEPWRPVLAGDDFGYYESVWQTLREGRMAVSDWMNPFTVGLSVPAAGMVGLTGNLWPGCMLTMMIFGLLGLWAFGRILRESGDTIAEAQLGVVVLAFFPLWLGKWTRFESVVPATSLMLVALGCYLQAGRLNGQPGLRPWLWLGAASVAAAWAISIRQNHVMLVLTGALGLLVYPGVRQRLGRITVWAGLPGLVFLALELGLPKTYAMEHMLHWRLSQLTGWDYLANSSRGLSFAAGCAICLLALSSPRQALRQLQLLPARGWIIGGLSLAGLMMGMLFSGLGPSWLVPATDLLLFEKVSILPALLTLVGALAWPGFILPPRGTKWQPMPVGLFLTALGYLALTSLWGYWEYYYLEITLLFWLSARLNSRSMLASVSVGGGSLRLAWRLLLLVAALGCWYGQRLSTDQQAARLQILEQAFRDGVATPAATGGQPLGLLGWNCFAEYRDKWRAEPKGNPLAFWANRPTQVYFRWRDEASGRLDLGDTVLRTGRVRLGFQSMSWTLFKNRDYLPSASRHRRLPLTRAEWQELLSQSSNN